MVKRNSEYHTPIQNELSQEIATQDKLAQGITGQDKPESDKTAHDRRMQDRRTKYSLSYDIHTHTVFSHGKGTIEDNVKAAREKGIRSIGISDHGPGHITYGVKRSAFPEMKKEIVRLRACYKDMEILLGVEANIIDRTGKLDVSQEDAEEFDFLLAGYHFGVFGDQPFQAMGIHIRNYWSSQLMKRTSKKQVLQNTEMIVRSIYENQIKILTHPGDKGAVDIYEVALACANKNTLMEISTWHDWLTVDGIREAAKTDVGFVISSDAHTPGRVGDCRGAVERILAAGLDPQRVDNLVME